MGSIEVDHKFVSYPTNWTNNRVSIASYNSTHTSNIQYLPVQYRNQGYYLNVTPTPALIVLVAPIL